MSDPILILEGVEKHFGDVAVLRGISAAVPEDQSLHLSAQMGLARPLCSTPLPAISTSTRERCSFADDRLAGGPRGGLLALGSGNYFRTSESSKALPCLKTSY